MPKDLKNLIDGIEKKEKKSSRMEEKIERLTILAEKQKRIISEQTDVIEKQKAQISKMVNVPDDIQELRDIIGTQRALIKEKELELEHTRGEFTQASKELELTLKRMNPTQIKIEAALETISNLKIELAQKNTEIIIKNEAMKTLQNKLRSADEIAKDFRNRVEDLEEDVQFKKEIEQMKIEHSEERMALKANITKLEKEFLDQKIEYQEKIAEAKEMSEKYGDIFKKAEVLSVKNNELKDKIKHQEASMTDLKKFKEENYHKIYYLDNLKKLMEEDPIYRSFFIIQEVGSISLEDLKNAVGAPIVLLKREVLKLADAGVIDMTDDKITAKKFDVS